MIELLLVMAILGILVGLFVTNFPASQRRARDTRRITDLKQYQTSVELFANRNNGLYPYGGASAISASDIATPSLCGYVGLNTGGGVDCPEDPKDNQATCSTGLCRYYYRSNGSGAAGSATGTQYVIWARLEQPASNTTPVYVICSNGKTGGSATAPSSSACPI